MSNPYHFFSSAAASPKSQTRALSDSRDYGSGLTHKPVILRYIRNYL